ncbi:hypothetical protein SAMN06265222_11513 [Neorhodopirellula lusitana]|uniref:Probable sensor domain-containing protein n=1 Tax=Neorhodopirellula lusitana TaxID=445327 RepID=A0ABY1QKB0_9BACT|nr:hypothetical protein [Neorhodopirellula lusitana]SMP72210.1 hypothetical protein SAMN06265222_11513 [Neorhodopirellula lusitana]
MESERGVSADMNDFSAYPGSIAAALRARWLGQGLDATLLPGDPTLVALLDTMYQASLLREEGVPVQCRVMFADPQTVADGCDDSVGTLHVLTFDQPTPLSAHNLRKLAAAAGFYRAVLGVMMDDDGLLVVWGMLVTGTDWVNRTQETGDKAGGRQNVRLPPNLLVQVLSPGHLIAASGYTRVLESSRGQLHTDGFDPFQSLWLQRRFRSVRETLMSELDEHRKNSESMPPASCRVCDHFIRDVAQATVKRTLRLVRTRRHGGILVYLPTGAGNPGSDESSRLDEWFRFRVRFTADESTLRFRRLIVRLLQRVAVVGDAHGMDLVTWDDCQHMQDAEISQVTEALIEFSHLLADLMSVDGSLVLDHTFQLIGFGGEILGNSHARKIHQALDLEVESYVVEPADTSGTRHRSAYRLVSGCHEALAVIVSQDGDVRFVAQHEGNLTYWPYLP